MTKTQTHPPPALASCATEIERALAAVIDGLDLPESLLEAVHYGALGGGKRLRPALTLLACEACGGERSAAHPAACALELVHCFSLVHDDLPALDDDQIRRGRPTLHVRAGEAMAILAGDAMLTLPFLILADAPFDAERRGRLARELARATLAMIAGQVHDMTIDASDHRPEERLMLIHRNKTGALLRCAARLGGICANACEADVDRLSRFGEVVGVMFQAVDDLLDVTQTAEHLGKASGKDDPAGKLTFPGLFGVQGTRERIEALRAEAAQLLTPFGEGGRNLSELADFLAIRTR